MVGLRIIKSASSLFSVAKRNLVSTRPLFAEIVSFSFFEQSTGDRIAVSGEVGKSVLDVALAHQIDIEGACGGEMACSTCHVIVPEETYNKLPKKKEEEEDMLDLAWGRKATSRLCCQVKVTKDLEGVEFTVPSETNNML